MEATSSKFDSFAILEIMGHQKYAGRVTEQALGGASFVRVDVPEVDGLPAFSKLFGGGSIFCITPVSEEVAMAVAKQLKEQPLKVWDLPEEIKAKMRTPAIAGPTMQDDDEDYDQYGIDHDDDR
jgi:hypothetical protein